jgi:hypothetical protein
VNIPQDVFDYAISNNLSFLSTGGDIDYVKLEAEGCIFVVHDPDDAGCPETLESKAELRVYAITDEEWDYPISQVFSSTRLAIDQLTCPKFRSEMISLTLAQVSKAC